MIARFLTPWRRLLTASAISNVGDGIYAVAFPLLGATLTSDPRLIAALGAAVMIPNLVLSLPAGVLVDRLDRGRLMVAVDFARVALLCLLVYLTWSGGLNLFHLFVIAVLLGTGELLFDIAASAYVPSIVPTKDLPRANGHLATAAEVGNGVIGPTVGGLLFASAAALPFAVDAVAFGIASLLILRFAWSKRSNAVDTGADTASEEHAPVTGTGFWRDAGYGLSWLWRNKDLRAITMVVGAWNLFGWMPEAILVLYVSETLGLGSVAFGLFFAATSVGAVVGGLASGRMTTLLGPGRVLAFTVVSYSLLMLPPAVSSSPWTIGAAFFLQGIPLIAWGSVSTSIRQTLVPDELLGRVGSVFRLMGAGMAPIGFLLGGFLGDWLGLREVFIVSGAGLLVAYLVHARALNRLSADFARRIEAEERAPATEDRTA